MKVKSKKSKGKIGRMHCLSLVFLSLFTFAFCVSVGAQQRDYFTDEEIELIRDNQQIDHRMNILVRTIDRRFYVLKVNVNGAKDEGKDWGALPTGTKAELLSDIRNILQKAIDDIDNLSSRPDSMVLSPEERDKKPKGFSDLFPKAVRALAKAAERYKPALKQTLDASKDEREKGLLLDSIEMCDEIIASVSKLN